MKVGVFKFEAHHFFAIALIFLFITTNLNNWRQLKGIFLGNWITYETVQGEVFSTGTGPNPFGDYSIAAEIEYGFKVNGEFYVSDLVNFAHDMDKVDFYLQKYPKGKQVQVYYEKGNPTFAVLEPDNWSFQTIQGPALVGLCFIAYLFFGLLCHRFKWCVKFVHSYHEFTDMFYNGNNR